MSTLVGSTVWVWLWIDRDPRMHRTERRKKEREWILCGHPYPGSPFITSTCPARVRSD